MPIEMLRRWIITKFPSSAGLQIHGWTVSKNATARGNINNSDGTWLLRQFQTDGIASRLDHAKNCKAYRAQSFSGSYSVLLDLIPPRSRYKEHTTSFQASETPADASVNPHLRLGDYSEVLLPTQSRIWRSIEELAA